MHQKRLKFEIKSLLDMHPQSKSAFLKFSLAQVIEKLQIYLWAIINMIKVLKTYFTCVKEVEINAINAVDWVKSNS